MPEIWKSIIKYESLYEVSSLGRVRSIRSSNRWPIGRIKTPQKFRSGYFFVDLRKDGKKKACSISRLVCTAFHGPCPPNKNCNHKDGIKSNNKASNLEWVTHSENCKHKYRVLGYSLEKFHAANPWPNQKGDKHPRAKTCIITKPDGEEIIIRGLKHFCRQNNLDFGCMVQIATGSGRSKTHRDGWKCRYI